MIGDLNWQVVTWQVVGDKTGHYRAMCDYYKLQSHGDEFSVQTGLTYQEACQLSNNMIQMNEVQES
jgi:hypothetical protein